MTFFFQTNPIGVILKIVMALPSIIIAVGVFFFSTVHKTSNKTRASIINVPVRESQSPPTTLTRSQSLITEHRHLSPLIKSTISTHSSQAVTVWSQTLYVLLTWLTYLCLPPSSCAPPSPRSIVPTGSPGKGIRTCYSQIRLSWTLPFPAHSPGLSTLPHSTTIAQ